MTPAGPRESAYGLISDVHGNLPALEAVLAALDARDDVDAIYHLGDLVGYGPWPDEVVATLRERAIPGVAGNYDSTTAVGYEHCGCRYEDPRQEELSHLGYAWTLEHTTPETKRWLGGLPFRIDLRPLGGHTAGPRLILVHGNPVLNTVYWTEDRSDGFCLKMAERLGAKAGDVVAFGHTHRPWHRVVEGIHFVNTGSVGRPKDGDWRACYVVVAMDGSHVDVELVRVDYDLERATRAIRESGLPDDFAKLLETGGMPSNLEILAYEHTDLGPLCLRRRRLLSRPGSVVTEITLGHQLLMSSRYTVSEERLAEAALEMHAGSDLRVLVGGLGLGYTARAALASSRVASVHALELLPQVIDWMERGLVPLSSLVREDERLSVGEGDAYALLAGPPSTRYDVILVDIDHAPDDRLQEADGSGFYTAEGLGRARRHLAPKGVLGVWSAAESADFSALLRDVFGDVTVEPVTFFNDLVGVERTDWLFLAS